jgi:general secretion pathway protein K
MTCRSQRGFVLALTIVVLAAVAVAATFIAERVRVALAVARADRDATEFLIAAQSQRADVLIRGATEPRARSALGAVVLDGRAYRDADHQWISLMDARGLLNLNGADAATVRRFVAGFGLPAQQVAALTDVLLDFRDEDDLRRLNGAEREDYVRLGLAPPRNDLLESPTELRDLPAWRDADLLWRHGAQDAIGLHGIAQINPNTAPAAVLRALPGIDAATADQLVQQRAAGANIAATVTQLTTAAGAGGLYSPVTTVPSDTLVVTQWAERPGWALRYAVTHTPNSDYGPWRIEYVYRISSPPTRSDVPLPPIITGDARPSSSLVVPGGGN